MKKNRRSRFRENRSVKKIGWRGYVAGFVLVLLGMQVQAQNQVPAVTLSVKQMSVPEILRVIEKQVPYKFMYHDADLQQLGKKSLQLKHVSLNVALDSCLKGAPIGYEFVNNQVILKRIKELKVAGVKKITGKVVDQNGKPLPGVAVLIEGTSIGVATDLDGNYRLECPEVPDMVLVFSFVGMETHKEPVNGKSLINVTLNEEVTQMDEVVVNGIFTRKKESFTGSATTFTKEDLKRVGNQNIIASLKNMDPSFMVLDNVDFGSDPNRMPEMQIRGASGLPDLKGEYTGNPNEPLFILDGFEASKAKIFDLDMNRVASVTILKDAAAKAIYGSKAANGVVVVETITPEQGRLRLSYNGDLNIQTPDLSFYDLCNAEEKLKVELNAGRYTAVSPSYNQLLREQYNEILKDVESGVNTYWLSKPLRVGVGQKHSIYMDGGDEYMKYGIDFSYNNVAGVMKESRRETITGAINLSYRYKNIIFRNVLQVTFNRADDSPYGSFSEYTSLNPYYTPYDENGNVKKILGTFQSKPGGDVQYTYNPLYNATIGTKNFSKYREVTENFYAEWKLKEYLKLIGRFSYTYKYESREDFYPGDHSSFSEWKGDNYFKRGSYSITDSEAQNVNADITANFSRQWNKHLVFLNAGWNMATSNSDSHGMTAWGFLNNRVDHITFARQYADNGKPSGSESITREIGIIGALNYSYDNRYLLDLSFRTNASSVFGSNSRWGTFWSAGLGWNVHHEAFLKDSEWMKMLKIRGSVGYTGSQNFNPYQAMTTFKFFSDKTYDNIAGAYLMGLANKDLQWQQTRDVNAGADIQLFKGLTLRFDWYVSNTNNLLVDFTLPTSTGFSSYKENLGESENKGYDATMNWQLYRNPKTQSFVSVYGSIAHNTNKLKKISDALKSFNKDQDESTGDLTSPLTRYEEGQSTSAIWGVRSLGIDPINGKEILLTKDGNTTYTWNAADQVVIGESNPKYRGNLGLNSEYKGVGLNVSLSYRWGGDYYNQTLVSRVENVNIANNVDRRVFEGTWQNPGDITAYKKISNTPTTTRPTSRFVEKYNELSLASVNIYYDFKFLNLKKYRLERLKFAFYMSDICQISTVKTEKGLSYPFARSFSFSLQATF